MTYTLLLCAYLGHLTSVSVPTSQRYPRRAFSRPIHHAFLLSSNVSINCSLLPEQSHSIPPAPARLPPPSTRTERWQRAPQRPAPQPQHHPHRPPAAAAAAAAGPGKHSRARWRRPAPVPRPLRTLIDRLVSVRCAYKVCLEWRHIKK